MAEEVIKRITIQVQLVLQVLLDRPDKPKYGLEISDRAGLASGTIHPILARLERAGWVESWFEDIDPVKEGRPRRRYYQLSADGAQCAQRVLENARVRGGAVRSLRDRLAFGGAA